MSEAPALRRRLIRFAAFELDARSGELRKAGERVSLQDQPLKVLESLLERPGELVTREELRQRLWPGDTFVDFEHGVNAAVKRLRETLGDSAETPQFVETVPRRGYRFVAAVERDEPSAITSLPTGEGGEAIDAAAELPSGPRLWTGRLIGAGAIAILVTASFSGWLLSRSQPAPPPLPMKLVPFTGLTGVEVGQTFSPDGTRVAFTWNGETQDNWDIYVKLVGSADVRRLTTNSAFELNPQWSPDGRQIAYLRADAKGELHGQPVAQRHFNLWMMSALGGAERKVSDLPVTIGINWSPDGRYIAAGSPTSGIIYQIPAEGGEPRALLRPTAPETVDQPAFSPDGRFLAYSACRQPTRTNCHVQIVGVDAAFMPHGAPRRLTRQPVWRLDGIAWGPDGTFVVYSVRQPPTDSLWRISVDGTRPPERVELAGLNAFAPMITAAGDLVFSRLLVDLDVYRLEPGHSARPVARSSGYDGNPQLSPDGRRFAFSSSRSGETMEVWTAADDGSDPRQLTHGPGAWQGNATWSPDGRQIAFDSLTDDGSWHIWTIDTGGGIPRQITKESGIQSSPSWSHDGQWIYFSWDQGIGRDIWRTHVERGTRERLTHGGGGLVGRESADGQSVFYQPGSADAPLLAQPIAGGAPRTILPCVAGTSYAVVPQGIYYVPCLDGKSRNPNPQLHVLNPVTGKDGQLGRLEKFQGELAVSPDGRTMFYTRLVTSGADLMMIQNFR